jgi:hypothetical protein
MFGVHLPRGSIRGVGGVGPGRLGAPPWGGVGGGQERVVGSMNTVKPTRRVVLEMVEEFVDTIERFDDL